MIEPVHHEDLATGAEHPRQVGNFTGKGHPSAGRPSEGGHTQSPVPRPSTEVWSGHPDDPNCLDTLSGPCLSGTAAFNLTTPLSFALLLHSHDAI